MNEMNRIQLKKILISTNLSGVYDITDWTHEAVKVLLETCASTNQIITLKQNSRYFMPITYPSGPMLEMFIEAIISNAF